MGRGRLVFKGEKDPKKKKKKKSKHHAPEASGRSEAESHPSAAAATASSKSAPSPKAPATPQIQKGLGKITTSGTVVTGHEGTRFTRQLETGDALLVTTTNGGQEEMRVITMRLSDASLNLSSAFSQNLVQPTSYRFIPKPRTTKNARSTTAQEEEHNGRELVYRESTEHGSYRIRRVQLDHEASRGAMLEMRAKKKSDKYC